MWEDKREWTRQMRWGRTSKSGAGKLDRNQMWLSSKVKGKLKFITEKHSRPLHKQGSPKQRRALHLWGRVSLFVTFPGKVLHMNASPDPGKRRPLKCMCHSANCWQCPCACVPAPPPPCPASVLGQNHCHLVGGWSSAGCQYSIFLQLITKCTVTCLSCGVRQLHFSTTFLISKRSQTPHIRPHEPHGLCCSYSTQLCH
jgi:hypothetical protein